MLEQTTSRPWAAPLAFKVGPYALKVKSVGPAPRAGCDRRGREVTPADVAYMIAVRFLNIRPFPPGVLRKVLLLRLAGAADVRESATWFSSAF